MYLYEKISREITKSVQDAVYTTGQKLPSLRETSEHYNISMATAIKAYEQLEQEGIVEVRVKSGYFVLPLQHQQADYLEITQPELKPTSVDVAHLAMSLINESRQPRLTKLGAAVPDKDMLPVASLARTLAGVARREWKSLANYENTLGNDLLRKQIAKLMRESGYRCKADEVIVSNGCLESLNLALRCVANKGDTIAIESPTYFGVLQVIENCGLQALEIPTHPQNGIDPEALKHALETQKISACILIPSFSNPLGSCMPEASKKQVLEILEKADVPLIEDDIYGDLSYATPRPRSMKSYDLSGNVLYCSSFSKTLSPGLRIGWILPGRYAKKISYQKFLDNISTNVHSQLAVAEFIKRGQYRKAVRRSTRIYQHRMEKMQYWIKEYFPEGTMMSYPKGGFITWLELPKSVNAFALYRKALEKRISITPGLLFSAQKQYHHHIRLSCGSVEGERARLSLKTIGQLAINEINSQ